MTRAECDSTRDVELQPLPVSQHEHEQDCRSMPHSPGCMTTAAAAGGACTSSLLRLALTSGSAYAIRFTTCLIDINARIDNKERTNRKASHRTVPYWRRNWRRNRKDENWDDSECTRNGRLTVPVPYWEDDHFVSIATQSNQDVHITRVKEHCDGLSADASAQCQYAKLAESSDQKTHR